MNPDHINKIVPKTKVSGITFDMRTGFVDTNLNFYVKIIVWKEDGKVVEARGMHINYSFKGTFSADHF